MALPLCLLLGVVGMFAPSYMLPALLVLAILCFLVGVKYPNKMLSDITYKQASLIPALACVPAVMVAAA